MADPLARLAVRHPGLEVHVVGATLGRGAPFIHHPWSIETEVSLVAGADIGLAPMPDDAWTRGKCGLKVLLYMACGLPVVASRAGVHPEIVTDQEDGWLIDSQPSFESAIDALVRDPEQRARLGAAARATVERRFSVRAVAPRLAALLHAAAEAA